MPFVLVRFLPIMAPVIHSLESLVAVGTQPPRPFSVHPCRGSHMRTTLKIVLPLIVSVASVSLLFATYQVRTEKRILRNDLTRRAEILGESLQEGVEPLLDRATDKSLQRLVERFGQREHLKGVAVYSNPGAPLAITSGLPPTFRLRPATASRAFQKNVGVGEFLSAEQSPSLSTEDAVPLHIYALPLHRNGEVVGSLAVLDRKTHV